MYVCVYIYIHIYCNNGHVSKPQSLTEDLLDSETQEKEGPAEKMPRIWVQILGNGQNIRIIMYDMYPFVLVNLVVYSKRQSYTLSYTFSSRNFFSSAYSLSDLPNPAHWGIVPLSNCFISLVSLFHDYPTYRYGLELWSLTTKDDHPTLLGHQPAINPTSISMILPLNPIKTHI